MFGSTKTMLLVIAALFSLGAAGWMNAARNESVRQLKAAEMARDAAEEKLAASQQGDRSSQGCQAERR